MNIKATINLFHILVVAPILLYLGYYKNKSNNIIYYLLGAISLIIPTMIFKTKNLLILNYRNLIRITHLLLWLPLFVYISLYKNLIPIGLYPIITLLGISVLTVHTYLFMKNNKINENNVNNKK